MPKVDFYLLSDPDPKACNLLACRIAEKAYGLGHRVHIHTDSNETSAQLDVLLWTFRDRSFVPHEIEPETDTQCPVTIGHGWTPAQCEVLINLAAQAPEFFNRFERVAEIVGQESHARDTGRERYRVYREQGCELTYHTVRS
jgi:DNA polymerase III subunit chi